MSSNIISVEVKQGGKLLHRMLIDVTDLSSSNMCSCVLQNVGEDKRLFTAVAETVVVEPTKGPLWVLRTFLNKLGL